MIKNSHNIYFNDRTSWSKVLFKEIAERVSQSGESGELPYIEFEDIIAGEGKLNKDIFQRSIKKTGKIFNPNDVLFGKLRPYLRNIFFANISGIAVGDFWVLRPTGIDPYLLFLLVNSQAFMKVANISSGSKMPRADWKLVSNMELVIPESRQDQQSISKFFKLVDSYMAGVSNKLASLKQIKSACLQSMFPLEGESVPKVRFKGFNEDWKTIQLSECLFVSHDKNTDKFYTFNDVLSVSDDYGVRNQIELLGRSYAGKSVSNYGILHKEEIVFTKSPLKSKPFGVVKMNTYKTGIVSVLYAIYKAKESISPQYIHYYFDPAWRLNKYLSPLVNKGAKNTMNISDEYALSGEIMIPSFEEQQKIAAYFKNLDHQISLQTQRLEKLKHIKSACLDQMFV